MHELITFFIRNSKWFLFAALIAVGCAMLCSRNPYQHHVYLTTANSVVASVYNASNEVYSYFNLRQANEELNERNAMLQAELQAMQEQLYDARAALAADTALMAPSTRRFDFIVAHVISNSVARPCNYITINRGALDGVKPEMGVIDQNGVVGIVNVVGPHSARIISVLNPNLQLSCKVKNNDNFGSLVWEGGDPEIATLIELPKHTVYHPGDTVITTGYSNIFPEGVPVGVVLDDLGHKNDNFFTLRVKLFTDFARLSNVQVITNNQLEELRALELSDQKPK